MIVGQILVDFAFWVNLGQEYSQGQFFRVYSIQYMLWYILENTQETDLRNFNSNLPS